MKHLVLAQEKHKDGHYHLHFYLSFDKAITITRNNVFDYPDLLINYHPNIQAVRSIQKVLTYITKDSVYLLHGMSEELFKKLKQSKTSESAVFASSLIEDPGSYRDLIRQNPRMLLLHPAGCKALLTFASTEATRKSIDPKPWLWFPEAFGSFQHHRHIIQWLVDNMCKPRKMKQKHLWLWSDQPSVGKTTFLSIVTKYYRTYHVPMDEHWYDLYLDGTYDLCVMDDYNHPTKTIAWLNRFLQGFPTHLNQRNAGTIKHDNLPTIITSNHSPEKLYYKANSNGKLLPLLSRLKVVKISDKRHDDYLTNPNLFQEETPNLHMLNGFLAGSGEDLFKVRQMYDSDPESDSDSEPGACPLSPTLTTDTLPL